MDQSRRAFFGLGAALAGLTVASKVKAEPAAAAASADPVMGYQPIVGEVRQVFSHMATAPVHSHSWIGHTHEVPSHNLTYASVPVTTSVMWNGNAWVQV